MSVQLEDAERDLRTLEFIPDTPPGDRKPLAISQDLDPQDWTIGELALTVEPHLEATNYGDPNQPHESSSR